MKAETGQTKIGKFYVRYAGFSDRGRLRNNNEDDFLLLPENGIFCLTDGVGGREDGKTASTLALESIKDVVLSDNLPDVVPLKNNNHALLRMLLHANATVYDYRKVQRSTAATTIVMVRFHEDGIEVGHVGDSRMYRWAGQSLTQCTRDHSLVEQLYQDNLLDKEEIDHHPQRHVITRAIGARRDLQAHIQQISLCCGDIIILCSDGLTTMLTHQDIQMILIKEAADIARAGRALIAAANKAGGRDNITVVLLQLTDSACHAQ